MILSISHICSTIIGEGSKKSVTLFLNSFSEIHNLKDSEDLKEDVICPISGSVIKNPILLNGHYYEKDSLMSWLNIKKIDPLTNLEITDNDLNTNIPYKFFRKRNLEYIDKYQYSTEINRVTINNEIKKMMFHIKDTKECINIWYEQVLSYEIQGLFDTHCSLEILLQSKIDKKSSTLYIMHSNLATMLFKNLNKIFNPDDNEPLIDDDDDFDL